MSAKTVFITEYQYRQMTKRFRELLKLAIGKRNIVGRYVANVQASLHNVGENELASELENQIRGEF